MFEVKYTVYDRQFDERVPFESEREGASEIEIVNQIEHELNREGDRFELLSINKIEPIDNFSSEV